MNLSSYIPTGRTSLVKTNDIDLQVQTEYAYRPYPRITTSITNKGQVLHKIEKKLNRAIESFEEQSLMEVTMKKQHQEVIAVIKDDSFASNFENKNISQAMLEKAVDRHDGTQTKSTDSNKAALSLLEKFKAVSGVSNIYQLDNEGNFINKISGEQFRKKYSVIFKNLHDIIDIFSMIPGITFTREKGVYEVDRNKLYMVSAGDELYFVTVDNSRIELKYEQILKEIIDSIY